MPRHARMLDGNYGTITGERNGGVPRRSDTMLKVGAAILTILQWSWVMLDVFNCNPLCSIAYHPAYPASSFGERYSLGDWLAGTLSSYTKGSIGDRGRKSKKLKKKFKSGRGEREKKLREKGSRYNRELNGSPLA